MDESILSALPFVEILFVAQVEGKPRFHIVRMTHLYYVVKIPLL